jgi:hypothetical protein
MLTAMLLKLRLQLQMGCRLRLCNVAVKLLLKLYELRKYLHEKSGTSRGFLFRHLLLLQLIKLLMLVAPTTSSTGSNGVFSNLQNQWVIANAAARLLTPESDAWSQQGRELVHRRFLTSHMAEATLAAYRRAVS